MMLSIVQMLVIVTVEYHSVIVGDMSQYSLFVGRDSESEDEYIFVAAIWRGIKLRNLIHISTSKTQNSS